MRTSQAWLQRLSEGPLWARRALIVIMVALAASSIGALVAISQPGGTLDCGLKPTSTMWIERLGEPTTGSPDDPASAIEAFLIERGLDRFEEMTGGAFSASALITTESEPGERIIEYRRAGRRYASFRMIELNSSWTVAEVRNCDY